MEPYIVAVMAELFVNYEGCSEILRGLSDIVVVT